MNKTKKLTLTAMLAALSVATMCIPSLMPNLDMGAAMLGAIVLLPITAELGKSYFLPAFFAAALLSFLVCPQKSTAVYFFLLFGWYQAAYPYLSKIKKARRRILKASVFILLATAETLITVFFLTGDVSALPMYITLFVGIIATVLIMVLYDRLLFLIFRIYIFRFRDKVVKLFGKKR